MLPGRRFAKEPPAASGGRCDYIVADKLNTV